MNMDFTLSEIQYDHKTVFPNEQQIETKTKQ